MAEETELVVPASVLAACWEITERRVRQLADEEIIPKASRGKYPLVACVQAWARWWRQQLEGKAAAISKDESRARLMAAKAESAMVQAELMRGSVYPREDVEAVFRAALTIVANHLAGLGGRVCGELAPITDPASIATLLDRETRGIRERCAAELERLGPPAEDRRGGAPPASGSNGRGVGRRKPRAPTRVV